MKRIFMIVPALFFVSVACIRFGQQDCDDAQPTIPEGAILSNAYGSCGDDGFFKVFPGQSVGFDYSMDLGPSYRDLDIRWKIDSDIFYDVSTNEALGREASFPSIRNYGGSYEEMRTMSMTLYPVIPDNQIGKGNIQANIESTAFNDCGESLPAKARIEVVNSGNLIQTIRPEAPVKMGYHVQAYHNNKLYMLFGRRSDFNTRDNFVFDLNTRQWSTLPAFSPTGTPDWDNEKNILFQSLYGTSQNEPTFSWVQTGSKVYIFAAGINALMEFDLNTQTFRNIALKPAYFGTYTRAHLVALGNKIYLTPYESFLDYNSNDSRFLYSFDTNSLVWQEEAEIKHGLVKPLTVIGSSGDRGTFSKIAFARDNQIVMVYENDQVIYFDTNTKTISTGSEEFKSGNIESYPLWGFNFSNNFYFFHKDRIGNYYLYEKSFVGVQAAFNFFSCPRQGIDQIHWSRGARANVVDNTIFIGTENHGLQRIWLNE